MTWYNLRTQIIYLLFDKYYDYLDYTYGNHMPTCVVQYILQQLGGQSVMLQPMTTTTTTTKVSLWRSAVVLSELVLLPGATRESRYYLALVRLCSGTKS